MKTALLVQPSRGLSLPNHDVSLWQTEMQRIREFQRL